MNKLKIGYKTLGRMDRITSNGNNRAVEQSELRTIQTSVRNRWQKEFDAKSNGITE